LETISAPSIEYTGPALTAEPSQNLCFKAAQSFFSYFPQEWGVRIGLEKRIPYGAGLGGGSSDAASVLIGMAKLAGIDPKNTLLPKAAIELGSDVPFFLTGTSAAIAQGRGEVLKPVVPLKNDALIVILWSGREISTKWAYQMVDQALTFDPENINLVVRKFQSYSESGKAGLMGNDFEIPIFGAVPELASARKRLLELGAAYAGLSGSGSAIFGVFSDGTDVDRIAAAFDKPWQTFMCHAV